VTGVRFPGAKVLLAPTIIDHLPRSGRIYCEPFAGRGNILWRLLEANPDYERIWINDIRTAPYYQALKTDGHRVPIEVRDFYEMKREFELTQSPRAILHEPFLTYDGTGYLDGGPRSDFRCGVGRYGYERTMRKLAHTMHVVNPIITDWDYRDVLPYLGPNDLCVLDPPYASCDVGAYRSTDIEHCRLLSLLKHAKFRWLLIEFWNPIAERVLGKPIWRHQERQHNTMCTRGTRPRSVTGSKPLRMECFWTGNY
jgi:site-specific DNA-adenine methylase